eukprot:7549084-Pyramimonas_sp.AAC.1
MASGQASWGSLDASCSRGPNSGWHSSNFATAPSFHTRPSAASTWAGTVGAALQERLNDALLPL